MNQWFDKSFNGRFRDHHCISYKLIFIIDCMSYIQWMNECSMILSMTNKYVLLRVFWPCFRIIFLMYTYDWSLNNLFIFHLCVHLRGFSSYMFVCISILWGEKSYIIGILISWSCMHMVPSFNNECTSKANHHILIACFIS